MTTFGVNSDEEGESMSAVEDSSGIVKQLGELPPGAIVDEEAVARMFDRHQTSVKRAVERGELPPSVRIFGKPCWTVKAILEHIGKRLNAVLLEAERDRERIDRMSP